MPAEGETVVQLEEPIHNTKRQRRKSHSHHNKKDSGELEIRSKRRKSHSHHNKKDSGELEIRSKRSKSHEGEMKVRNSRRKSHGGKKSRGGEGLIEVEEVRKVYEKEEEEEEEREKDVKDWAKWKTKKDAKERKAFEKMVREAEEERRAEELRDLIIEGLMLSDKKMATNPSKHNYLHLEILVDDLPLPSYNLQGNKGEEGKRVLVAPSSAQKFAIRIENTHNAPLSFRVQIENEFHVSFNFVIPAQGTMTYTSCDGKRFHFRSNREKIKREGGGVHPSNVPQSVISPRYASKDPASNRGLIRLSYFELSSKVNHSKVHDEIDVGLPLFGENLGFIQKKYMFVDEAKKANLVNFPPVSALSDYSLFKKWLNEMQVPQEPLEPAWEAPSGFQPVDIFTDDAHETLSEKNKKNLPLSMDGWPLVKTQPGPISLFQAVAAQVWGEKNYWDWAVAVVIQELNRDPIYYKERFLALIGQGEFGEMEDEVVEEVEEEVVFVSEGEEEGVEYEYVYEYEEEVVETVPAMNGRDVSGKGGRRREDKRFELYLDYLGRVMERGELMTGENGMYHTINLLALSNATHVPFAVMSSLNLKRQFIVARSFSSYQNGYYIIGCLSSSQFAYYLPPGTTPPHIDDLFDSRPSTRFSSSMPPSNSLPPKKVQKSPPSMSSSTFLPKANWREALKEKEREEERKEMEEMERRREKIDKLMRRGQKRTLSL